MLYCAGLFFVIAILAAVVGFGGFVPGVAVGAKILCGLFLAMAGLTFFMSRLKH